MYNNSSTGGRRGGGGHQFNNNNNRLRPLLPAPSLLPPPPPPPIQLQPMFGYTRLPLNMEHMDAHCGALPLIANTNLHHSATFGGGGGGTMFNHHHHNHNNHHNHQFQQPSYTTSINNNDNFSNDSSISPNNSSVGNNSSESNFPFCDDVNKYEKIGKIGQGTFGEVFKARHIQTRQLVALKKVLMENEKEGFPITALREIKILQLLKHENVVNLIEICRTTPTNGNTNSANYKATFYLVFDFCEHDLSGLLSNINVRFTLGEIKSILNQLLHGLLYVHKSKILHRDMKASNILITRNGVLKLADFGLARPISDAQKHTARYTNRVVTLWYRAPELLLGARNYGPPIDLWGVGCIMAEMWTRFPILQGSTEQRQLSLIANLCGSITPKVWPTVEQLEFYPQMKQSLIAGERQVKEKLRSFISDANALDLLNHLLILDPSARYNANEALDHDFFWTNPMPEDLREKMSKLSSSMFEFTANRRRMFGGGGGGGAGVDQRIHHAHLQQRQQQLLLQQQLGGVGGPGGGGVIGGDGNTGGGGGGSIFGQYMDHVF